MIHFEGKALGVNADCKALSNEAFDGMGRFPGFGDKQMGPVSDLMILKNPVLLVKRTNLLGVPNRRSASAALLLHPSRFHPPDSRQPVDVTAPFPPSQAITNSRFPSSLSLNHCAATPPTSLLTRSTAPFPPLFNPIP